MLSGATSIANYTGPLEALQSGQAGLNVYIAVPCNIFSACLLGGSGGMPPRKISQ